MKEQLVNLLLHGYLDIEQDSEKMSTLIWEIINILVIDLEHILNKTGDENKIGKFDAYSM